MDKINLINKFEMFSEHWSPKVVGELNGQQVKLAKLKGEFIFHQHENEDELFMGLVVTEPNQESQGDVIEIDPSRLRS